MLYLVTFKIKNIYLSKGSGIVWYYISIVLLRLGHRVTWIKIACAKG